MIDKQEPIEQETATAKSVDGGDSLQLRFNKYLQGLKDENKAKRKLVMQNLDKEIHDLINKNEMNSEIMKYLLKPILNMLNDQMEKCREITCDLLIYIMNNYALIDDLISIIIIQLRQRLGQKGELIETSEELRFKLYELTHIIISKSDSLLLEIHLDDLLSILYNSLCDSYAEVKKKGCSAIRLLANKTKREFHRQSESLIKPLITNITHQHSRVRKDVVECIGDVIMNGNNKSVDDVLIHLAQRLFDQTPIVRSAVISVVGNWLLDLVDRYSYHAKLIPLLLTGFNDELVEIKNSAEALWWDIGIKYEKENENDLKDKIDFGKEKPKYYPKELERPNIGCRELIRLHLSKILPAILNDIGDWVEATRVKSIQLLHVLIWQAEDNITQHLELVLQTLFKAANDTEQLVKQKCVDCAKLIAYFTNSQITFKLLMQAIKRQPNHATICVLNGILQGYDKTILIQHLDSVFEQLIGVSATVEFQMQKEVINCCESILDKYIEEDNNNEETSKWVDICGYSLFRIYVTTLALTSNQDLKTKINEQMKKFIENNKSEQFNKDKLYNNYMPLFINELTRDSDAWNEGSYDRLIFQTLIIESDLIVDKYIDLIIPIMTKNMQPNNKDAETRTKFLILLSHLIQKCDQTNENNLNKHCNTIVNDMIIPNLVWKAGRTATAIRMTATATLLTLLRAKFMQQIKLDTTLVEALIKQATSILDDENKLTRLYTCNILQLIFNSYKKEIHIDQLHQIYTELLKRLDDNHDDVRFAIIDVFRSYVDNLASFNYDKVLYQAHIQMIYQGLIIHLDDSNEAIQEKILDVLKVASVLHPEMLSEEINKVKDKHRTSRYCDQLLKHINSTNK